MQETEIGLIPVDWDLVSFGDAFDFLSTATYSRADLNGNGDILYVHYGDIHTKWNNFLDLEKNDLPSIDKEKQKKYSVINEGDLIMADASEDYEGIGKSVEVKHLGGKKAISGLHTFLLRERKGSIVSGFRGYIHSNQLVKKQFDRLATGLKVYGVSKKNLKTVLIPIPKDPAEQSAIAQVLSDTDTLIESLNKLIEKKKNIKQGAMQELLTGRKRLEGFSREWEEKKLGDVIKLQGGFSFKSEEFQKIGVPIIRISNFDNDRVNLNDVVYSKKINLSEDFIIKMGDVLIAMSGATTGKVGIYNFSFESYQNQRVGKFVVLNKRLNDLKFISHQVRSNTFKEGVKKEIAQGAQPNISGKQIEKIEMLFPKDPKEQSTIAQVLSDMDVEIEELERKRDKYIFIKKGMMQELLTGRIRLKY